MDKLGEAVEAGLRKYFGNSGWSDAVFANARQYVINAIKESGIVGVIDQKGTLVPRVYTDADAECWVDSADR